MQGPNRRFRFLLLCAIVALCASPAGATSIQDLVRLKGHERNVLTGMGIVVGLNGTGDSSKDSLVAARPYAKLLQNLGNPVASIDELAESDSYALVNVTMEIPATGVREGDRLDVTVSAMFNASSLEGGQLIVSPLRLPRPDSPDSLPLAYAQGSLIMPGDNPRVAIVRQGGQMLHDIRTNPITTAGTMHLVLKDEYAGYPIAAMIAASINDEFVLDGYSEIAAVEDAKNIKVLVPTADRRHPAPFIAALMTIPIDPTRILAQSRIVVNEEREIILVTGNVQIGPVAITHSGLSITNIAPQNVPPAGDETTTWAGIDTTDSSSRSSTNLQQLLAAFEQLNVPVRDQIAIIYELRKTGALHAEIIAE